MLLCAAMLLAALDADAARFYRSVDENGNVTFSDRPDGSATTERFDVKVFTPDPVTPVASKADEKKPSVSAQDEEMAKEEVKVLQAKRQENCTIAKERLRKLQNISRIYSEDGKGNRAYLSDEDRLVELAIARKDISEWCQK